jgi:hypothetical protein
MIKLKFSVVKSFNGTGVIVNFCTKFGSVPLGKSERTLYFIED